MQYSIRQKGGDGLEIVVSNKASRPLNEQIVSQIKAQIMSGELKAGEALPHPTVGKITTDQCSDRAEGI